MPAKPKKFPKKSAAHVADGLSFESVDYGMKSESVARSVDHKRPGAIAREAERVFRIATGSAEGEPIRFASSDGIDSIRRQVDKLAAELPGMRPELQDDAGNTLTQLRMAIREGEAGNLSKAVWWAFTAGRSLQRLEDREKYEGLVQAALGSRDDSGRKKEATRLFLEDLAKRKPGLPLSEVERQVRAKGFPVGDIRRSWSRAKGKK